MKALIRFFVLVLAIVATTFGFSLGSSAVLASDLPATNFYTQDTSKIDLNNSNINAFRRLRGFYPTLGRVIIENAPYSSLDDVLNISGLSEKQKQLIRDNASEFTLKRPDESMGRERINNSSYRL
jgi:photosystem II PsbU protein